MTSIGELLYGDVDQQTRAGALEGSLRDLGLLAAAIALAPSAGSEVAGALSTLLDAPVGNLALRGWRKHRDVLDALEETEESGDRQVVRLARHKVSSSQSPSVEVATSGARQTVLEVDLKVELEIGLVDLTIEAGQIVGSSTGETKASGRLSASGQTIVKRELTLVDLDAANETRPPDIANGSAAVMG
jgi:hypothetical protein